MKNEHQAFSWRVLGKASVLVDGQFGSTGKGLTAAWLAENNEPFDVVTTNAAANAGHTTKYKDNGGFVCYHMPTHGVVSEKHHAHSVVYLNAGSIIDPDLLRRELVDLDFRGMLQIHPRAAVIEPHHKEWENHPTSNATLSGSTRKGVGQALASKVTRSMTRNISYHVYDFGPLVRVAAMNVNQVLLDGSSVVVEIPQGTGLSLNHGLSYPHVTSRDCHVGAGLSDAGIHHSLVGPVCMVVRTYPIRVGHITADDGSIVGNSGPFYPDSVELSWEHDFPGIEPERTTVTKRMRRIATWSHFQYLDALSLNRPTLVMLNFCNYLQGASEFERHVYRMRDCERMLGLSVNHIYGFGPHVEDVTADFDYAISWFDHREFR